MHTVLTTAVFLALSSSVGAAEWNTHCFSYPEHSVRGCSVSSPIEFDSGDGRATFLVEGEDIKGPVIYFPDPAHLVQPAGNSSNRQVQMGQYRFETPDGAGTGGQCLLTRLKELAPGGGWVETDLALCDAGIGAGLAIGEALLGQTISVSIAFGDANWRGLWHSTGYEQEFDAARSALQELQ